jgi:DNA (cytosine-5)-methyltransferase 1
MCISYDKLWKLLIDKKMNRTDLKNAAGISFNVLAKMSRNEFVSLESLCKICSALLCDIGDVIELVYDTELKTSTQRPERKTT